MLRTHLSLTGGATLSYVTLISTLAAMPAAAEIPSSGSSPTSTAAQMLSSFHDGDLAQFSVAEHAGFARVLSGRFPDFFASDSDESFVAAAEDFLAVFEDYVTADPEGRLRWRQPYDAGGGFRAIQAQEYLGEFRIVPGEMVFVFDASGVLRTFQGPSFRRTAGLAEAPCAPPEVSPSPELYTLERIVERITGSSEWLYESEKEVRRYRCGASAPYHVGEKIRYANKAALLPVRNLTAANVFDGSGTTLVTDWVYYWYNPFFGNCTYELSYDASTHNVTRVDFVPGGEVYVVGSCNSAPTFPGTSWSNDARFRQSEAFRWVKRGRALAVGDIFSYVAPVRTGAVNVRVDDSSVGGFPGAYNAGTIKLAPPGSQNWRPRSVAHEYGHHIAWLMDGPTGTTCAPAIKETPAVNETVGDLYSAMIMHRAISNLEYDPIGLLISPHTGSSKDSYQPACPNPPHGFGNFFAQGVWESLYGDDKESTDDFDWDKIPARRFLSRALAYALKVSPDDTTYDAIGTHMFVYLQGTAGIDDANRFRRVMNHHGTGI